MLWIHPHLGLVSYFLLPFIIWFASNVRVSAIVNMYKHATLEYIYFLQSILHLYCHNPSDICIHSCMHHSHAICLLSFYSYVLVIEIFTALIDFQELRNELYFKVVFKFCYTILFMHFTVTPRWLWHVTPSRHTESGILRIFILKINYRFIRDHRRIVGSKEYQGSM